MRKGGISELYLQFGTQHLQRAVFVDLHGVPPNDPKKRCGRIWYPVFKLVLKMENLFLAKGSRNEKMIAHILAKNVRKTKKEDIRKELKT